MLVEPLSFWGGIDAGTGTIIDSHHPQCGAVVSGQVLVMPTGRGSSSSSSVFLESVRLQKHPLAIVLNEQDFVLVIAAIVARALYGVSIPICVLPMPQYRQVKSDDYIAIVDELLTVHRGKLQLFGSANTAS